MESNLSINNQINELISTALLANFPIISIRRSKNKNSKVLLDVFVGMDQFKNTNSNTLSLRTLMFLDLHILNGLYALKKSCVSL